MTMMRATGTAAMSASDVVYVEGWIPAVLIFAFVFAYVAYTDGGWNIAAGVAVLVVSGLFAFLMWRSLTDYPLTYKDGDRPTLNVDGTGLYQVWDLAPGASVSTVLEADGGSDAEAHAAPCASATAARRRASAGASAAGDPADESSMRHIPRRRASGVGDVRRRRAARARRGAAAAGAADRGAADRGAPGRRDL